MTFEIIENDVVEYQETLGVGQHFFSMKDVLG
jgi:hypothetical protein